MPHPKVNPLRLLFLMPLLAGTMLSGCATLPSSGPTAAQIVKRANDKQNEFTFDIVPLDSKAVEALNSAQSARIAANVSLATLDMPSRPETLGPGDVLNIDIYEVGVSLFSRGGAAQLDAFDPSAHGEKFPAVTIDPTGAITLPFIGSMFVAGLTPSEVEAQINRRLSTKSQHPQAMVTIAKNMSRTVIIAGNVNKPGRYDLTSNRERLLDAVALAGGATGTTEDTVVRFERSARTIEQRLDSIRSGTQDDLVLAPRDYIELLQRPRSFTVFGLVRDWLDLIGRSARSRSRPIRRFGRSDSDLYLPLRRCDAKSRSGQTGHLSPQHDAARVLLPRPARSDARQGRHLYCQCGGQPALEAGRHHQPVVLAFPDGARADEKLTLSLTLPVARTMAAHERSPWSRHRPPPCRETQARHKAARPWSNAGYRQDRPARLLPICRVAIAIPSARGGLARWTW